MGLKPWLLCTPLLPPGPSAAPSRPLRLGLRRPTTAAATGKTAGKTTRIDFTSGAWLRSGPGQACFDTSIYMPAPATRHSLAAHAMSNNFTQPYTDSGIVDI